MNSDDKNPEIENPTSPELEARIVAWVAGEASAFEAAELKRLIQEKPELAVFKRRIEAVQGLVAEAVRPEKVPFRLAPERRAKLLQEIRPAGNPPPPADANIPVYLSPAAARRKRQSQFQWMMGMAACLVVGVLLFAMAIPSFQKVRRSDQSKVAEHERILYAEIEREKESESKAQADASLAREERKTARASRPIPIELPSSVPEDADADSSELPSLGAVAAPRSVEIPVAPNVTFAQAEPQPPPTAVSHKWAREEVKMQPFVVTTPEEVRGYTATSTLAGTRVRTDLNDVSSSVSAVANQFMKDTGATNAPAHVNGQDWANKTGDFGQAAVPAEANSSGGAGGNSLVFGAEKHAGISGRLAKESSEESQVAVLSQYVLGASDDKGYAATRSLDDDRTNAPGGAPSSRSVRAKKTVDALNLDSTVEAESTRLRSQLRGAEASTAEFRLNAELDAGAAGSGGKPAKPVARPAQPEETFAEVAAAKEPFSTFSLHVSDVSFRLAQAALARGEAPEPDRIRPEEFYNAFDYGDPAPAASEKIACRIEQAAHPFLQQRNLVRIAMKVPATGRGAGQPLRLTVLLDTSGSMEREDRAAALHRAMEVLVSLLGPNDRVTLVGFARQPRLLAEDVHGDQAGALLDLIARTPAEGGTNFEEALKLGGELARRHFDPQAQNRIVLMTDGAANLGDADPAHLTAAVETLRQQGLAFDACGVGTDGLDDAMLEALTRKGAGRYSILDSPESADAGFARQLAGAFRPAAENVKVQVRFNPARVGNYRLIGFEHHRLRTEDFRNDKVAAAELAAEEAAVAVYQVEVLPQGEGELGDVYVRFRDTATNGMVERSWTMMYDPQVRVFDRATPAMQLAGTAALLAEKLHGSAGAEQIKLSELAPVINSLRSHYGHEARVQELVAMFAQMRRLGGE